VKYSVTGYEGLMDPFITERLGFLVIAQDTVIFCVTKPPCVKDDTAKSMSLNPSVDNILSHARNNWFS
jgi:hypothetical protein